MFSKYFGAKKSIILIIIIFILVIASIVTLTPKQTNKQDCTEINFVKYMGDEASPPNNFEENKRVCSYLLNLSSKISLDFREKYPNFNFEENICNLKTSTIEGPPANRLGWSINCSFNCCKSKE